MLYLPNKFGYPNYAYAVYDGEPLMKNYKGHISEIEYLKVTKGFSYKFRVFHPEGEREYLTNDVGETDEGINILSLIKEGDLKFKRCTI